MTKLRLTHISLLIALALSVSAITPQRFVLRPADHRLPAVLGYADSLTTDLDNLPPALVEWASHYDASVPLVPPVCSDSVRPLLASKWAQTSPFNDSVPLYNATRRAAAGCVATAMAQIMYYYRYPDVGIGEHGYRWYNVDSTRTDSLFAHFGATQYLWNQMRNTYKSAHITPATAAPVAQLLYHCGVAVDMSYDSSKDHQSSAYTKRVPGALETYFGYDSNYQALNKSIYSYEELAELVRDELRRQHPVLINASNGETGHAFLCDGFNTDGYFHINWGWGGTADGYYLLPNLKPSDSPEDSTRAVYNKSVCFYVGIQPPAQDPYIFPYQMGADSVTFSRDTWALTDTFSMFVHKMQNFGMHNYSGAYGIALSPYTIHPTPYTENDLIDSASVSLKAGYHKTILMKRDSAILPDLPNGKYRLCAAYLDHDRWLPMLCRYADTYTTIYVCDGFASTTSLDGCDFPTEILSPFTFQLSTSEDEVFVSKTLLMSFGTWKLYLLETSRGTTIIRTKILQP